MPDTEYTEGGVDRISRRTLWRIYAGALAALIIVVGASHLLADWTVRQQEAHARIINLAGTQRMLSQRIAGGLAEAERVGDPRLGLLGQIHADLNKMEDTHLRLTNRTAEQVGATLSPAVDTLYFTGDPGVDRRVTRFIASARTVLDRIAASGEAPDPERVRALVAQARGPLLGALNQVVRQYQADAEAKLDRLRLLNLALFLVTLAVIALELWLVFRPLAHRLDAAQETLEGIARTDPLTGCWNRRALFQNAKTVWALARRTGRPLAVALCDIDHFKRVNDSHGHAAGDAVIRAFAATCLEGIREPDLLGRYGGEEFVIVLPDTDAEGACEVAERIRAATAEASVEIDGRQIRVTASFGVAAREAADESLHALIDRADRALYAAKNGGRDQVRAAA